MQRKKLKLPKASNNEYFSTQTAYDFHKDNSRVKGLLGPIGCGKSVACLMEIMKCASTQNKGHDGIRRSRWAIIRNTYPELKSTTIQTWLSWFPEERFGKIKYDSPISHKLFFKSHPDLKECDVYLEVYFIALDKPRDIKKLRSLELTGAYFNELQYMDEKFFTDTLKRTNRYPSKKDGTSRWSGVIWDANPPSTLHWMFGIFEKHVPDNYKVFKYEPAMLEVKQTKKGIPYAVSRDGTIYINNPNADYVTIQNDPNYWLNMITSMKDEAIKVDILGQYGVVIDGRPVHDTYNDKFHYSPNRIKYNPNLELGLGFDFGLTPAVALVQLQPNGQLCMIKEYWSTHMGLRDFLENVVIPDLDANFKGWRDNYYSQHDPAGESASQTDGKSCAKILKEFGIISHPAAANNNPTPRRDGLKFFLGRMTDGQPAFAISSDCQLAREGLLGNFMYGRVQVGGEARYTEKPVKNIWSHICEGLEYIVMRYARETQLPDQAARPKKKRKSFYAQ